MEELHVTTLIHETTQSSSDVILKMKSHFFINILLMYINAMAYKCMIDRCMIMNSPHCRPRPHHSWSRVSGDMTWVTRSAHEIFLHIPVNHMGFVYDLHYIIIQTVQPQNGEIIICIGAYINCLFEYQECQPLWFFCINCQLSLSLCKWLWLKKFEMSLHV